MDIFLTLVSALVQVSMAFLGIYVSIKPRPEKAHRAVIAAFLILGSVGITSNVVLQIRSQRTLDDRLTSIDMTGKTVLRKLPGSWSLDAEHLALLTQRVSKYASSRDAGIRIICVLGDPDSNRFAGTLVTAFRAAGWNLLGAGYDQAVSLGAIDGVFIHIHSRDSRPSGLKELVTTLREGGIEPRPETDDKVPDDRFEVVIGRRPQ